MNKALFFSFIHPKVFNFLSGAENKVTITVFLSRKKSKSSKTGRLIGGRCVQVSLCCIKLFDENALSLNFFTFFGRRGGDSYSLLWAHFLESLTFYSVVGYDKIFASDLYGDLHHYLLSQYPYSAIADILFIICFFLACIGH